MKGMKMPKGPKMPMVKPEMAAKKKPKDKTYATFLKNRPAYKGSKKGM
jgi:hypothetical protein